jgi:Tfp pilus assembly protein PilF
MSEEERTLASDIDVGYYYLREKNYRAAESRLKEAVAIDPSSTGALLGLAQAEQKLGEDDAARGHYEKYLELNSSGEEADKVRRALAQLK